MSAKESEFAKLKKTKIMNSCHAFCVTCDEEIDWDNEYCKICKEVNQDLIKLLKESSNKSWAQLNEVIYKDVQDITLPISPKYS
jgi:hypothetical protein